MYKYPYGDSQQLNLDWILAKLKELEAAGLGLDLEEVSNALISLTYNNSTSYRRYDYAFRNGKLYRCLSDTSGVFDPSAWQEALIGDDLSVLTRWINAIDAAAVVDVKFDTSGTNGKIQQKYHDQYHDVVEVDYTPVQNSKRPLSSNAGYELNGAIANQTKKQRNVDLSNIITNSAISDGGNISTPSPNWGIVRNISLQKGETIKTTSLSWQTVTMIALDNGTNIFTPLVIGYNDDNTPQDFYYTATADCTIAISLNTRLTYSAIIGGAITILENETNQLNGAINQTNNNIAYIESGNTASRNYTWNDYVVVNGQLYRVKTNISQGDTFTVDTNIETSYALNSTYGIVVTPTIVEPTYFELASYDTQVIGNFIFGSVSVKCIVNSNANPGLVRFNMLSKPAYGWQLGMITDQWGRNPSGFVRCYCVANASTNNRLEIGGIQMTAGQYCTIIIAMPVARA